MTNMAIAYKILVGNLKRRHHRSEDLRVCVNIRTDLRKQDWT